MNHWGFPHHSKGSVTYYNLVYTLEHEQSGQFQQPSAMLLCTSHNTLPSSEARILTGVYRWMPHPMSHWGFPHHIKGSVIYYNLVYTLEHEQSGQFQEPSAMLLCTSHNTLPSSEARILTGVYRWMPHPMSHWGFPHHIKGSVIYYNLVYTLEHEQSGQFQQPSAMLLCTTHNTLPSSEARILPGVCRWIIEAIPTRARGQSFTTT